MQSAHARVHLTIDGRHCALVLVAAVCVFVVGWSIDQPLLVVAFGLAPIAGLLVWTQPFLVCSLFVAISHFRLHEAYPALTAAKPALLLGVGALALVVVKGLLSADREAGDTRLLRAACLVTLAVTLGVAAPYAEVRGDGAPIDVIVMPVVLIVASVCALTWGQLLNLPGKHRYSRASNFFSPISFSFPLRQSFPPFRQTVSDFGAATFGKSPP